MATTTEPNLGTPVFTLPNQLTAARMVLAVVFFVLVGLEYFLPALVVFVLAAGSDALDGYVARRYGLVTPLGRILDPFVDKLVVLGAFIFLLPLQSTAERPLSGSGLAAWMVTIIVTRELLVTGLRSFLEQRGADFSATASGKLKMIVQCVAIGWILLYVGTLQDSSAAVWAVWIRDALIWLAVGVTIASGVAYSRRAMGLL